MTLADRSMSVAKWFLAFGLALLGTPAFAVPCGDGRDDASIRLEPTRPVSRSYDARRLPGDELAPVPRNGGARPPELPDDGRVREWRRRVANLPLILRVAFVEALPVAKA